MCCIHWQRCSKCHARRKIAYRPCSGLIQDGACEPEECVGSFAQEVDASACIDCNPGNSHTREIMPQWKPFEHNPGDCEGTAANPICIDDVSSYTKKCVCKLKAALPSTSYLKSTCNLEAGHHRARISGSALFDRETTERELTLGRVTGTPPISSKRKAELHTVNGEEKQSKIFKGKEPMAIAPACRDNTLASKEKVIYQAITPDPNISQPSGENPAPHNTKTKGKKDSTTDIEASFSTVVRQKFHLN